MWAVCKSNVSGFWDVESDMQDSCRLLDRCIEREDGGFEIINTERHDDEQ